MTKDTQSKSNKKEIITRAVKTREDKKRNIKKHIDSDNDNDNGSYFADKCHAFVKWKKSQSNNI